jgi:hypothetical protein
MDGMESLFDVMITACGTQTGEFAHKVRIVNRYKQNDGALIGQRDCRTLEEALEFARGTVTAFMEGTRA